MNTHIPMVPWFLNKSKILDRQDEPPLFVETLQNPNNTLPTTTPNNRPPLPPHSARIPNIGRPQDAYLCASFPCAFLPLPVPSVAWGCDPAHLPRASAKTARTRPVRLTNHLSSSGAARRHHRTRIVLHNYLLRVSFCVLV